MTHTEFKKRYMPNYHLTMEDAWSQVPHCTTTPDEGVHLNVALDRDLGQVHPSRFRYVRTWGVDGWT